MSSVSSPIRAFSVGKVFATTFGVLFRNLGGFVILAVLINLGIYLIEESLGIVGGLLNLVGFSFLSGLVAYGTYRDLRGDRAGLGEIVGRGLRVLLPVLIVGLLVGLAYGVTLLVFFVLPTSLIGASSLAQFPNLTHGVALFVVLLVVLLLPAIYVIALFWVAVPAAAAVERPGIIGALRRSIALTKGERWRTVGVVIVFLVAAAGVVAAATALSFLIAGSPDEAPNVDDDVAATGIMVIASVLAGVLVQLVGSVATAVSYFLLRAQKEGVGVGELAAVFD